jgi:hypothetical protein
MARRKDSDQVDGLTTRSSSEQAEVNKHVARTPQSPDTPQGGPALTGHTTEAGVVEDQDGNVQAVHQTTVITDPESPLAVQIPDEVNTENPLNVHQQPSPNEVAAGADPVEADEAGAPIKPDSDSSSDDE